MMGYVQPLHVFPPPLTVGAPRVSSAEWTPDGHSPYYTYVMATVRMSANPVNHHLNPSEAR